MAKLKIAEVFAGIGGVTGGFLDAGGYEPVAMNDVDPAARDTFIRNFPGLKDRYWLRSIRSITGPELLDLAGGEIDGLLGCPPCQGLSAAGLRSEDDERNELLREMRRLIWSIRPKFFVIENVPRLLATELYESFELSMGSQYRLQATVLNAAEYGVPQLRRRAVVIGFRSDLDTKPSMPSPTHGGRGKVFDYFTGSYVKPDEPIGRILLKLRPEVRLPRRPLVTLQEALGDLPVDASVDGKLKDYRRAPTSAYQRNMRKGSNQLCNHQAWHHGPEIVRLLTSVRPGDCPTTYGDRARNATYFSQAYARLHPRGLARTLTTNFHNPGSGRFTHYAAARTLTIREAMRLQSFPDSFQFEDIRPSDAERLVGNAFPRRLARALAVHISRLLGA